MKYLLIIPLLSILCGAAQAQPKPNRGLTSPQPRQTLPVSRAVSASPKAKSPQADFPALCEQSSGEYLLSGGWKLAEASKATRTGDIFAPQADTRAWYDAVVPGTVLTTLIREGIFPDPYFGLNNLAIPDTLCRTDWWYRTSFRIPPAMRSKQALLLFEGINYRAEVWLNAKRLGRIDGAFHRGEFDITPHVDPQGDNILAVRILPPPNPGIPHEESLQTGAGANGGIMCIDGPTFICSEGWDWMPGIRDRNIGIWQPVRLSFTDGVRTCDPQIVTDLPLPDTTSVRISVAAAVENHTSEPRKVTIRGTIEGVIFEQEAQLAPHSRSVVRFSPEEYPQLIIHNPRLWWPNTLGRQEMYELKLETLAGGSVSHTSSTRFGVREYGYELTADIEDRQDVRLEYSPTDRIASGKPLFDNTARRQRPDKLFVPRVCGEGYRELQDQTLAPYLVLKVNGERLFCRGGNWGMDDAMKNCSRERLEPSFRLHRDAHMNMIRNWTGESTEKVFYDLCDEYGMVVFNDFWISTEGFNLDVSDEVLFMSNATDVVRRFRNHPSIAVWNPRNEGFAPDSLEIALNAMVAREDGTRHYQANSRSINLRPSGPWNYLKKPADYFTRNAAGFSTEIGTPSVPTAESMRAMMAKEDLWPIGDVWAYHDLHNGQKEYLTAITDKYGEPTGLEDFCTKAQMVNYDSHRAIFEAWNSHMWNNTSGVLLWMTHPAWPSTVWQIYSWDYETHGAYYGTQKACEPIHVQMNLDDRKIVAVNNTLYPIPDAKIFYTAYTPDGQRIASQQIRADLAPNALTECFTPHFALPEVYLERVWIEDRRGKLLSQNEYWGSSLPKGSLQKLAHSGEASVKGKVVRQGDNPQIELRNTSSVAAVSLKLNLREAATGERILPAYFSDGYFTLLPGEKKVITLSTATPAQGYVTIEGYNLKSVTIIDRICTGTL